MSPFAASGPSRPNSKFGPTITPPVIRPAGSTLSRSTCCAMVTIMESALIGRTCTSIVTPPLIAKYGMSAMPPLVRATGEQLADRERVVERWHGAGLRRHALCARRGLDDRSVSLHDDPNALHGLGVGCSARCIHAEDE